MGGAARDGRSGPFSAPRIVCRLLPSPRPVPQALPARERKSLRPGAPQRPQPPMQTAAAMMHGVVAAKPMQAARPR